MANYGLYANINEGSLSSAASELTSKMSTSKSNLSTFQGQLTDDIWKAGAKQTLLTAFSKIEGEVYNDIEQQLNKISQIAGHIGTYKSNETAAKTNKANLDSEKAKGDNANKTYIQQLEDAIKKCEQKMDEAENAIKSLCG